MKTTLKYCLSELTGTVDDLVLYRNRKTGKLLARRYCIPKPSAENTRMAETSRNLFALAPSEAYKADLKLYLLLHNELSHTHKPFHSWVNLYMTLMSRLAKAYPETDLKTLTRNAIYTNNLPCKSVSAAVQAGLLSPVPGWEKLVAEM